MKKRSKKTRLPEAKPMQATKITEQELFKNFEKYSKFIQELGEHFKVSPSQSDQSRETSEPNYVSQPVFIYQIHASV